MINPITKKTIEKMIKQHKQYLNRIDGVFVDKKIKEKQFVLCDSLVSAESSNSFDGVDLRYSIFSYSELPQANFKDACLCKVSFFDCRLAGADFSGADLTGASFVGCNLAGANFTGARMDSNSFTTTFSGSILRDIIIDDDTADRNFPIACPETGGFTAFKKVLADDKYHTKLPVIAELYIPASAKRSSAIGRKCRCSKAKVIGFLDYNRKPLDVLVAFSSWNPKFIYEKGKIVQPEEPFCENRFNECASGIHFFMTFNEAVRY